MVKKIVFNPRKILATKSTENEERFSCLLLHFIEFFNRSILSMVLFKPPHCQYLSWRHWNRIFSMRQSNYLREPCCLYAYCTLCNLFKCITFPALERSQPYFWELLFQFKKREPIQLLLILIYYQARPHTRLELHLFT